MALEVIDTRASGVACTAHPSGVDTDPSYTASRGATFARNDTRVLLFTDFRAQEQIALATQFERCQQNKHSDVGTVREPRATKTHALYFNIQISMCIHLARDWDAHDPVRTATSRVKIQRAFRH